MTGKQKQENPNLEDAMKINRPETPIEKLKLGGQIPGAELVLKMDDWGEFQSLMETVKPFVLPGNPPSPSMPVFVKVLLEKSMESKQVIIKVSAISTLKRPTIIEFEFFDKIANEHKDWSPFTADYPELRSVDTVMAYLEKKGYVVMSGEMAFH